MTNPVFVNPLQTVGMFGNEQAAKEAKQALQSAGFASEQLTVQEQKPDAQPPAVMTQLASSAIAGAIAFGLFGCLVGFMLSQLSQQSIELAFAAPDISPIVGSLLGGLFGSFTGALLGAATGVQVPTEQAAANQQYVVGEYRLELDGSEEDLLRAREILQNQ